MSSKKSTQKVGKYVLGQKVGEGGFGIVRCAVNEETGEKVAIKILDKAQLQLMKMTPQVKKEIGLLTILRHPNIVTGYEVLNSASRLFLIMEYVDGGDMHSLLMKKKRLPEEIARTMFSSLVSALNYCHSRGVYHRDLKLENLLLTRNGSLKVCDFGLASVRNSSAGHNELCNTMVGTEDFTAPEIIQGRKYSGSKADMWSAGVLLFTMIAGYCPFQGPDTRSIFDSVIRGQFSFPKHFPMQPRKVVSLLLVPDPEKRASAKEILECEWFNDLNNDTQSATGDHREHHIQDDVPELTQVKSSEGDDGSKSLGNRISNSSTFNQEGEPSSFTQAWQRLQALSGNEREASTVSNIGMQIRETIDSKHMQKMGLVLAVQIIPDFENIYPAMRDPEKGIHTADRRYRFRIYPKCFIGSEAVSWLSNYFKCSRQESLKIGQKMLEAEVFHHVCRDHGFKDEFLFFRFQEDDPINAKVLNMRQVWPTNMAKRNPVEVSSDLVLQMIALCKLHQSLDRSREIDIAAVQADELYSSFRNAASELQLVNFSELQEDSEKLAFAANCFNMLCMHSRVQIGLVSRKSSATFNSFMRNFQYNIGGSLVSIESLRAVLHRKGKRSGLSSLYSLAETFSPTSIAAITQSARSSKWRSWYPFVQSTAEIEKMLSPRCHPPFLSFIFGDGSPVSPAISALCADDLSPECLRSKAEQYIKDNVQFDFENMSIDLPRFLISLPADEGQEYDENVLALILNRAKEKMGRSLSVAQRNFIVNMIAEERKKNKELGQALISVTFAPELILSEKKT